MRRYLGNHLSEHVLQCFRSSIHARATLRKFYLAVDCSSEALDAEPYFLNSWKGKPIATREVAALAWLRVVLT